MTRKLAIILRTKRLRRVSIFVHHHPAPPLPMRPGLVYVWSGQDMVAKAVIDAASKAGASYFWDGRKLTPITQWMPPPLGL